MKSCFIAAQVVFLLATMPGIAESPALIPRPQKMEARDGFFALLPGTKITAGPGSRATAIFLARRLKTSTGYPLTVDGGASANAGILLTTNSADAALGAEGYTLAAATNLIVIRAPTQAGLFYGAQTLLQLLPPEIFSPSVVTNVDWNIPCVRIRDWPRFKWRGLMLDVSRHFFDKAEVEQILDEMALHKLNVFHWHLTDDQGWRIEIKKYPRLARISAWRASSAIQPPRESLKVAEALNAHPAWAAVASSKFNARKQYGGFYTPRDIREIVAYAAARHIAIVPEIEMPGHAVAALAAYPQFGCGKGKYTTNVRAGINGGVFDPGNPATFEFLDDVLSEVFRLFPGQYVHVGGDEVNAQVQAATWAKAPDCLALMRREGMTNVDQLQGWFTKRIAKFVRAHHKTLIGWTEIGRGGLPANAVIMDWKGGGLAAARAGHDVVMSPAAYCYLDHYQSTNHVMEPHAIGGYLPLKKVCQFDPIPARLEPEYQSHILGAQCNLWTEYVATLPHAEYMIWPRECALAEVTWSPENSRDWTNFSQRLRMDEQRLREMGVNYHR